MEATLWRRREVSDSKIYHLVSLLLVGAEGLEPPTPSFVDLRYADLSNADLSRSELYGTMLHCANLSGSNFDGAVFKKTNLSIANLTGANLSGANLNEAWLQKAVASQHTQWPEGFDPVAAGVIFE